MSKTASGSLIKHAGKALKQVGGAIMGGWVGGCACRCVGLHVCVCVGGGIMYVWVWLIALTCFSMDRVVSSSWPSFNFTVCPPPPSPLHALQFTLTPSHLHYGNVPQGSVSHRTIKLKNVGTGIAR